MSIVIINSKLDRHNFLTNIKLIGRIRKGDKQSMNKSTMVRMAWFVDNYVKSKINRGGGNELAF